MNNNHKKMAIFIFTFVIIFFIIGLVYYNKKSTNIVWCNSHNRLIHDDFIIDADYNLVFNNDHGRLNINGFIYQDKKKYILSRIINFTYTNNEEIYHIKSTQIEYPSNDQSQQTEANHHYPSFFYEEGKILSSIIRRDKYDNYVIHFNNLPIFYCEKVTK